MKNPFSHDEVFIAQLKSIELQINQNQLQEAAQQLNLLAKTSSHDPRLFLLGSHLAGASRNSDGMLEAARHAHSLAPQWPVATMHLASVQASRDQVLEAMALAEQALAQAASQSGDDIELLAKAASIAQRVFRYDAALKWLHQAEKLNPGDIVIRQQIGRTLSSNGDHAGAIAIYSDMLLQLPHQPSLLLDRLGACLAANQREQAVSDGEALTALDPNNEEYRFYLAIARGETPKTQPVSIIQRLFDGSAAHFDRHLLLLLKYKLPEDVAKLIHQWHPDRKGDVLDLGCGTGLLGAHLGSIEGVLVGVDVSPQMIEQAKLRGVYDRFHSVNLLDALQATPASLYHVITALDVLNYIGDLSNVIPSAHRILVPGGHFVFSCESGTDSNGDSNSNYALQSTYRFTHQRSYVLQLMQEAGFADITVEDRVLRKERGQPVRGFLVTASKPAQAVENAVRRSSKKKSV